MGLYFFAFFGIYFTFVEISANKCQEFALQANDLNEGDTATLLLPSSLGTIRRIWHKESTPYPLPIYHSEETNASCKYAEKKYSAGYMLQIQYLDKSDEGRYFAYCYFSNSAGWSEKRAELKISSISSQENNCGFLVARINNVTEGIDVKLSFHSFSSITNIVWEKENYEQRKYLNIENGDTYKISYCKQTTSILTVLGSKATYAHSGKYRVACGQEFSNVIEVNIFPVAPKQPQFRNVKRIHDCLKCIPAPLSEQVTVTCDTEGGSLPLNLSLIMNGRMVKSTDIGKLESGSVAYDLTPTKWDEDIVFKCKVKNPAFSGEIEETVKIYIYVKPSEINVTGLSVMENQTTEILCITYNGRPALEPTIIINSIRQNITTIQNVSTDDTYTVQAGLTKSFHRHENNVSVSCCVDFLAGKTCEENIRLDVAFPPNDVKLVETYKNVTIDGDANITLKCMVGSSNPRSSIVWTEELNEHMITRKSVYEEIKSFHVSRAYNGRKIYCSAKNDVFPDWKVSDTYIANITYAPLITIHGHTNRTEYIGSQVTITCEVDSNPESRIKWLKGEQEIFGSNGKTLDLIFHNVSLSDSFTYTCLANNTIGGFRTTNVTLLVKDPPLKPPQETSTDDSKQSLIGLVSGGAAAVIVAVVIACTAFCLIRHRRKQKPKTHTEPTQEDKTTQHLSHGERDRVSQRNSTAQENNPTNGSAMNAEIPEYASVAPKATRAVKKNEPKHTKKETNETTEHQLVYAELDLQTQPTVIQVEKQQHEATEYVGIDFAKTGTVKAEDFVEYGNM